MSNGSYTAAMTSDFLSNLGTFYGLWSSLETTLDYLIGRYLKLPHEETHILTAGMEFGRKANLLRTLVMRANEPNKDKIRDALTKIQNESKRNLFSHSLITSSFNSITFVYRKTDGVYSATETRFTPTEFADHLKKVALLAGDFSKLVKIDDTDFQAFGKAALSAARSATTSPQPPSSKA